MKKTSLIFSILVTLILPLVTYAAVGTFKDFANVLVAVVKGFINILFVSLTVGVAYGVAMYFINADNEKKREEIKGYLVWAVIGLTVTFGLWGFVQILCDTLDWCVVGVPSISPPA